MKTIEVYRKENKVLNPKLGDLELPQLIDLLANSYGHLNSINNKEQLPVCTQQRLAFAMMRLREALSQLDIDIDGYKM